MIKYFSNDVSSFLGLSNRLKVEYDNNKFIEIEWIKESVSKWSKPCSFTWK